MGDLVFDDGRRLAAARDAAREWRQVVVLKGARTVIADPDGRTAVSPFENPALASGGTGDVLAGTIGALLAQGLSTFEAAQLGVYLHAMAGEAVRARLGDAGLLASDLTPRAAAGPQEAGVPAGRRLCPLDGRRHGRRGVEVGVTPTSDRDRSRVAATRHALIEAGPGGTSRRCPGRPGWRSTWTRCVANIRLLEGLLPLGVRIEPVVKADAYGHGSVAVARALVAAGIRQLERGHVRRSPGVAPGWDRGPGRDPSFRFRRSSRRTPCATV